MKTLGAILQGAAMGAVAGSAAGPYGALAGAAIGGTAGGVKKHSELEREKSKKVSDAYAQGAVGDNQTSGSMQRQNKQDQILKELMSSEWGAKNG